MHDADVAEAFQCYIQQRLRFCLGLFGARVGQVLVHLAADGRAGHRCRVSTEIRPFGRVAVEERDPDLFAAIDRATGRGGWLFGRELQRVRDSRTGRDSVRLAAELGP